MYLYILNNPVYLTVTAFDSLEKAKEAASFQLQIDSLTENIAAEIWTTVYNKEEAPRRWYLEVTIDGQSHITESDNIAITKVTLNKKY